MAYPASYTGHKFNKPVRCNNCGAHTNDQGSYDAHFTRDGWCTILRPTEKTIAALLSSIAQSSPPTAKPTKLIHGKDEYALDTCQYCARDNMVLHPGLTTKIGKSKIQLVEPRTCRLCIYTMSQELDAIASKMVIASTRGTKK